MFCLCNAWDARNDILYNTFQCNFLKYEYIKVACELRIVYLRNSWKKMNIVIYPDTNRAWAHNRWMTYNCKTSMCQINKRSFSLFEYLTKRGRRGLHVKKDNFPTFRFKMLSLKARQRADPI